jgi:hypothetical protein
LRRSGIEMLYSDSRALFVLGEEDDSATFGKDSGM